MRFILRAYLAGPQHELLAFLDQLIDDAQSARISIKTRTDLEDVCRFVLDENAKKRTRHEGSKCNGLCFSDEIVGRVVVALVLLEKEQELERAARLVCGSWPMDAFKAIGRRFGHTSFRALQPACVPMFCTILVDPR